MVQESTSRPVDGDMAWLSCHRKISGLDSSRAASHTSSSFSSTERQRSTRRAFGWDEEVAAWKRSIPRAHRVKEVMPRDTACGDEEEDLLLFWFQEAILGLPFPSVSVCRHDLGLTQLLCSQYEKVPP